MIERTISKRFLSLAEDFKVLLVTGSRQVGKTTLLKMLLDDLRNYVTLDNKASLNLAKEDPESFFILNPLPCLIDEVQRAPELFLKIKELVDSSDKKNQLWLTGSQKPRLMKHVSDTLSGRVCEIDMFPFFFSLKQGEPYRQSFYPEFDVRKPSPWEYIETIENIVIGGYPEMLSVKMENRADWLASYISTYLLGDILDEDESLIDILDFRRLLQVLAARIAEQLNYTAIASETGLSVYKVKKLVSLLVSYGIIFLLPPYSGNTLKTIVKTPRMHFTDSGLCCALLGIEDSGSFLKHPLAGRIFESYVVSEMIRNARNNGDYANFYFYREENKGNNTGPAEIDLLKEKGGIIYPFEIKLNATPVIKMSRWFDAIPDDRRGMGTIVCMSNEKTLLSKELLVLPVSMI